MVEFSEDANLFLNGLNVILKFSFVQYFDRYLKSWISYILTEEDFAEGSSTQNFSRG
jgi:hypothetical protein